MTANKIRQKYIDFFKTKQHAHIPSAPLVPENDPTVLFTTAGMHPLIPYLMGASHPEGTRLVDSQKCIRTVDIEEVGDNTHLTFFEMLGNWSLGDYFKREAIEWSFEFLTSKKWLGLPANRLAISVFKGNSDAERDEESANIWRALGISDNRIAYLGKADNWWGPAGKTGPCGPDTEMFYWIDDTSQAPKIFDPNDNRWVEIWNNVFMQYNKKEDGRFWPLKQKNVDTGMGLERVAAILQKKSNVYETDLFAPIIDKIKEYITVDNYKERLVRIIADHVKASVFILSDKYGVTPSNEDQGYVLRKLIRRSIRFTHMLGIKTSVLSKLSKVVINIYKDTYPELKEKQNHVLDQLNTEEEKFRKTLEKGLKKFEKGERNAFYLYESFGFPPELTKELFAEKGIAFDKQKFNASFKKHQELSRKGAKQKFSGGLADNKIETTELHTATHLLHKALKEVLGENIVQKGSNITAERLRFDFPHSQKMTDQEIKKVEDIVNNKIKASLPVIMEEMNVKDAKKAGATGLFPERYNAKVKVYSIGDYSKEICGGPHVKNTSELGTFKIIKEESSSAGIRRIKAVLE